jgi:L-lactate dehydrogenase complex protein LldG
MARSRRAHAMSDEARADILAGIRRSLGVTGREAPRCTAVEERMKAAAQGIVPARGQGDRAARIALFKAEAVRVQTTIAMVATPADVPAESARYLRENNLPATLRLGTDARLMRLDWAATALAMAHGPSEGDDFNAISHAFAGIAETGTLVLVSGSDNPSTLNFLPDNHLVVLCADDLVGDMESVWARLRTSFGKGVMPRTVNLVTGPSRSGDIEQKLLLGAHGPRRLHIIVTAGDGAATDG